jgi:hypothetical protein
MAKPLSDTLRQLRQGVFSEEAGDQLAQLVQQVTEHNKSGKMTIELTVKPAGKKNAAVIVTGKCTVKAPQDSPDETLMFPTPEGNLLTEDPRQQKLDLKVAPTPSAATELRTATGA